MIEKKVVGGITGATFLASMYLAKDVQIPFAWVIFPAIIAFGMYYYLTKK